MLMFCCTSRNSDIQKILEQLDSVAQWSVNVHQYIMNELGSVSVVSAPSVDRQAINADGVLCPALPLFEDRDSAEPNAADAADAAKLALVAKLEGSSAYDGSPLMLPSDVNRLLDGMCSYALECAAEPELP